MEGCRKRVKYLPNKYLSSIYYVPGPGPGSVDSAKKTIKRGMVSTPLELRVYGHPIK